MTRGAETWITELTPLSFLARSAGVYSDKTAIVHGAQRWTYAEFARDAQRLARGLRASGGQPGDRVACLLPNGPALVAAPLGGHPAGGGGPRGGDPAAPGRGGPLHPRPPRRDGPRRRLRPDGRRRADPREPADGARDRRARRPGGSRRRVRSRWGR